MNKKERDTIISCLKIESPLTVPEIEYIKKLFAKENDTLFHQYSNGNNESEKICRICGNKKACMSGAYVCMECDYKEGVY